MSRRSPLPVLQPAAEGPTIRESRAGRWRTAVLIAVHLVIAAHIAHWLVTGRTVTPVEPSEAMAYSKGGIVNAGLIFFAAAIVLTAIFGRWFCGWACHIVALQDGSLWLLKRLGIRPKPLRSRLLRWVPLAAFLYMFAWPAVWRLAHGDRLDVRGSELTTSAFWATFPGWVVGALTFLVCGFAAVYFLGAKGFCTYACPYGAAFSFADKLSPMRIRVTDDCEGSGHCTAVCTSNVRVHEEVRDYGMVVDPGCMKCGDCVSVCPNDALYYGFGSLPMLAARRTPRGPEPASRRYPLSWSEEIVLGAAFIAAFVAWRGLFGYVPFLMALGLAGCLAWFALLGFRLATRQSLAFRHRELKRDGRLRPAGRAAIGGLVAMALLTGCAGFLQAEIALAQRSFGGLHALQQRRLDLEPREGATPMAPITPTAEESAALAAAAGRYERVARLSPVAWLGLDARLAWVRALLGDRAGFQAAAGRALQQGDSAREMILLWASDAVDHGEADSAAAALERLPERGTSAEPVWVALVGRAGRAEQFAAAESLAARGLARYPASVALHYNLGVLAAMQNQPERAAEAFRRALAIDPGYREARENLAGMFAAAGRFEEAATEYAEAIRRAPADAELRLLHARVLMEMGRNDEARGEVEEAERLDPANPAAPALAAELDRRTQNPRHGG